MTGKTIFMIADDDLKTLPAREDELPHLIDVNDILQLHKPKYLAKRNDSAEVEAIVYVGEMGSNSKKTLHSKFEQARYPYRGTVYLDDEDKLETTVDEWFSKGRRKRRATINGKHIATIFAVDVVKATIFAESLRNEVSVDVSELFSVPRITTEAWRFGLRPGWAVDLRTGSDLSQPSVKKEVVDQIDRDKPWLTVTSPPCTEHSSLQRLNRPKQDPEKVEARLETSLGTSRLQYEDRE